MLNRIVLNRTDHLHKMDLALNNLQRLIWYINVTMIPTVAGVLGTIPKGLVKGPENFEN